MKKKKIIGYCIAGLIILSIAFYFYYQGGSRNAVAGIREPVQIETAGSTHVSVNGCNLTISFLYEYDIEVLVVSTHDYRTGIAGALAPKDLALAWGTVAEHNTDVNFHWNQNNRWYYWRVDTPQELGIAGGELRIIRQSSNNHIIPADDDIKQKVKYIRRGDHVRLKGYLVNVDSPDFYWHTSTTRTDSGDHSCEVFYVTSVEWL